MPTVEHYMQSFPSIDWLEPVKVCWPIGTRFACRVCIADKGLRHDSPHQWASVEEAKQHIKVAHEIFS